MRLPRNFGARFGMSRDRFRELTANLRWNAEEDPDLPIAETDKYNQVRLMFRQFNDYRKSVVVPGVALFVDECMSFWAGAEGKHHADGIAHMSKLQRKPKSTGTEIKLFATWKQG